MSANLFAAIRPMFAGYRSANLFAAIRPSVCSIPQIKKPSPMAVGEGCAGVVMAGESLP